jgi:hypothetical protein
MDAQWTPQLSRIEIMGQKQTQKYCKYCEDYVLATRRETNHILHLLLTLITGGIWFIIWIIVAMNTDKWRCTQCGSIVTTSRPPRPEKIDRNADMVPTESDEYAPVFAVFILIGGLFLVYGLLEFNWVLIIIGAALLIPSSIRVSKSLKKVR